MSVLNKGFTIIELIVSAALLALLIMGSAQLFPRAVGLISRSTALTTAVNLAQAQIETILSQSYDTVSLGTYEGRHLVFENFTRQSTVEWLNPDTFTISPRDQGLKRVDVQVFYPTFFGERFYVLSTIITQR